MSMRKIIFVSLAALASSACVTSDIRPATTMVEVKRLIAPEMLVEVYTRHKAGDVDGAEDCYERYLPLVSYELQPGYGLAVRKEILRRRGAIAHGVVRAPGPRLTAADQFEIDRLLARLATALGRPVTA